jgi:hypothetical protein
MKKIKEEMCMICSTGRDEVCIPYIVLKKWVRKLQIALVYLRIEIICRLL